MLDVSDEIKDLYNSDSVSKQLILEFYLNKSDTSPQQTVTNENIISESMNLNEAICDSPNLELGSIFSSKFEVEIFNTDFDPMGYYLRVYMTIGNSSYKLPLFNGVIEESKLQNGRKKRHLTAYDDIYNILDRDVTQWYWSFWDVYKNDNEYISVKLFREKLLEYLRIEYEQVNLINDSASMFIYKDKSNITARKLLHDVCEINGCFGRLNRENVFIFKIIRNINYHFPNEVLFPSTDIYPGVYISDDQINSITEYINIDYGEYFTKPITKIEIYDSNYENNGGLVGAYDIWYNYPTPPTNPTLYPSESLYPGYINQPNTYEIYDNLCIDSNEFTDTTAREIFNSIGDYKYIPFRMQLRGLPYFEVGDVINVMLNDENQSTISTVILSRNLKGIQDLRDEFIANGDEYHDKEYKV